MPMVVGEAAGLVLTTTMILIMIMMMTVERGWWHFHRHRHDMWHCKLGPGVAVVPSMCELLSIL